MVKFPKENATLFYLADTTTSTTDSLPNPTVEGIPPAVEVGNVVQLNGKVALGQGDAFAIVAGGINGALNGVVINRNYSAYSKGRIWVPTVDDATLGGVCYYDPDLKQYGNTGGIIVGRYLTEGASPNVIQIEIPKSDPQGGGGEGLRSQVETNTSKIAEVETKANDAVTEAGIANAGVMRVSGEAAAADGKAVAAQSTANQAKTAAATAQTKADKAEADAAAAQSTADEALEKAGA